MTEIKTLLGAIDENMDIRPEFMPFVETAIKEGLAERISVLQLTEKGEALLAGPQHVCTATGAHGFDFSDDRCPACVEAEKERT